MSDPYLKSSDPNIDKDDIIQAAQEVLNIDEGDTLTACYEHGHWWVMVLETGQTWSVEDAECEFERDEKRLGISDGFCFEEV
jgi:hypothetical protein